MGGENKHVLIVDDNATVRKIHAALIRKLGGTPFTVENGQQAVDIHCSGASFGLVLMDKDMPVMDGVTATKKLRGMGVTGMIVGVTSHGGEDEEFMAAGLDHCFGKPLRMDKLTVLLDQLKSG